MTDGPQPHPPLVAVDPAAEINSIYAAMHRHLERLEAELVDAEAAALRAEARLAEFEPPDPDVVRRVTAHTDRVVESLSTEAQRDAEERLLDARRVAAQRVGEAAADAERQLAEARREVEHALAMAHRTSPVDRPPVDQRSERAVQSSTRADHGSEDAPAAQRALHDEFWDQDGKRPWTRRVPAALIAQLIGAVLVLALILARVG